MIPEDMKKAWQNSAKRIRPSGTGNLDMSSDAAEISKLTSLQRLTRSYIRFSGIGLFMCFFSLTFMRLDIFPEEGRILLTVSVCLYFAVCAIMDYWLYRKTLSIDIYSMRVGEVAAIACLCRRRHHQFMLALIPYAAFILGIFIYFPLKNGDNIWVCAVAGGMIGGVIGLRKYLEMMRDYRRISEEE